MPYIKLPVFGRSDSVDAADVECGHSDEKTPLVYIANGDNGHKHRKCRRARRMLIALLLLGAVIWAIHHIHRHGYGHHHHHRHHHHHHPCHPKRPDPPKRPDDPDGWLVHQLVDKEPPVHTLSCEDANIPFHGNGEFTFDPKAYPTFRLLVNGSSTEANVHITRAEEGGWDGIRIVTDIQLDHDDLQDVVDLRQIKEDEGRFTFLLATTKSILPDRCIKANVRVILPQEGTAFESLVIGMLAGSLKAESFAPDAIKHFKAMGGSVDYTFEDVTDTLSTEVHTASGNIHLERSSSYGDIVATSKSGTVYLKDVEAGGQVCAESSSGTVTVDNADAEGLLSVSSLSGSVSVGGGSTAGETTISTASGDIDAIVMLVWSEGVDPSASARSVSGSVRFTVPMEPEVANRATVNAKTASGAIALHVDTLWTGKFELSTWTGTTSLSGGERITYDKNTRRHKVGHKTDADGGGEGKLRAKSVSGDVEAQFV